MWSADLVRRSCRPRNFEWTCRGLRARSLFWRCVGIVEQSTSGGTAYALSRRKGNGQLLASTGSVANDVSSRPYAADGAPPRPVPTLPVADCDVPGDGDASGSVEDDRVPLLRFNDGDQYSAYFTPTVHSLINGDRGADVRVTPRFHSVAGLQLCSVDDGLSVVRAMFPSQCNVGDSLVGETVYLVANDGEGENSPSDGHLLSYSCRILLVPSGVGDRDNGANDGDDDTLVLQVEEPFVDVDGMAASGGTFTLMQHSQEPVVHMRMLDTLHDFGNLAKRLANAETEKKKKQKSNNKASSGGSGAAAAAAAAAAETTEKTPRPPKLSRHLYNAILCRPTTPLSSAERSNDDDDDDDGDDDDNASEATPPPPSQNDDPDFPPVRIPAQVAESLNERQVEIVAKVFTQALTLIRGPPGSGKTTVAAAIVQTALEAFQQSGHGGIHRANSKILVCASSNVAADNLCEKICQWGIRAVRINARTSELERRVPPSLKPYCLEDLVLQLAADKTLVALLRRYYGEERLTADELEQLSGLRSPLEHRVLRDLCDVAVTTCATAGDSRLDRFSCPLVLVDEVTQSYEPETLIPLMSHARHAVLIGDPCQLGPVPVDCAEYGHRMRSMYDRLILAGTPTEFLHTQFRMHPSLAAFSSRVFYGGELRDGVSAADRTPRSPAFPWPARGEPIAFWHDASPHRVVRRSCANEEQAAKVLGVVTELCSHDVDVDNVGVITPYSAQRALLKEIIRDSAGGGNAFANLEVCSVDEFQGREKDYIVVSCVRSSSEEDERRTIGFLDDPRRLNVMLTRAKYGVVIVGDAHLLSSNPMWSDLLCDMQEKKCVVTGDSVASLVQLNTAPFKRHGFVFELSL